MMFVVDPILSTVLYQQDLDDNKVEATFSS